MNPYWQPLYYLVPVIQALTILHAVKTERDFHWIWIILFLPVLGTLIYLAVEVLPEFQREEAGTFLEQLLNRLQPGRELRMLQENVEQLDTVEHRRALAAYQLRAGQPATAVEIYCGCLQGALRDDPVIMLELAQALFAAGSFPEARALLEQLKSQPSSPEQPRRDLLYARILEGLGDHPGALAAYSQLVNRLGSDEEVTCRYALLLKQNGQAQAAREMFQALLLRARRFSAHYRRSQRPWIRLARREIKAP